MGAARDLFAAGGVIHVIAEPALSGDVRGFDAFLDWYARRRALAGRGFRYEVDELLAGERYVVALILLFDEPAGDPRERRQVAIYRVQDGRLAEVWLYEDH